MARLDRLAREYAATLARARAALAAGDRDGYQVLRADARRLRLALGVAGSRLLGQDAGVRAAVSILFGMEDHG